MLFFMLYIPPINFWHPLPTTHHLRKGSSIFVNPAWQQLCCGLPLCCSELRHEVVYFDCTAEILSLRLNPASRRCDPMEACAQGASLTGKLSKRHAHKLIKTCERANAVVTAISIDTLTKFVFGQKVHNLRENWFALIHISYPSAWNYFALED
jgi:hypothetical protein